MSRRIGREPCTSAGTPTSITTLPGRSIRWSMQLPDDVAVKTTFARCRAAGMSSSSSAFKSFGKLLRLGRLAAGDQQHFAADRREHVRGRRGDAARNADHRHRLAGQVDVRFLAGMVQILDRHVDREAVAGGHGHPTVLGQVRSAAADDARHRAQADDPGTPVRRHLDRLFHVLDCAAGSNRESRRPPSESRTVGPRPPHPWANARLLNWSITRTRGGSRFVLRFAAGGHRRCRKLQNCSRSPPQLFDNVPSSFICEQRFALVRERVDEECEFHGQACGGCERILGRPI